VGDPVQFVVHEGDQFFFGGFAAGGDLAQQQRDLFVGLIRRVLAVFGERQNGDTLFGREPISISSIGANSILTRRG
jgi:hypothetical protein